MVDTIFDPVDTHVNGFGAASLDGVIGYTGGAGRVGFDWGTVEDCGLWVAQISRLLASRA
jgi:hypothetical protein